MKKQIYLLVSFLISSLFSAYSQQIVPDSKIMKVYVVCKTHLDIGFTDIASKVIDTYNHEFFPAVLALSEQHASDGKVVSYPWTQGSWLIWDYLQTANDANQKRLQNAIQRGDVWWHAMPFNLQVELCDSSLMDAAFELSHRLDKEFGRTTTAAEITDVPGVTRSIIPILKRNGIKLLYLGSNPGAALAQVPEIFRWRNTDGNEIVVIHEPDYGGTTKLPDSPIAVSVNFTGDNKGPHTQEQIEKIYSDLKKRFPNAEIIGSSFDAFASAIEKYCHHLPVITQEIGDTWMYGAASDPKMIAEFRELMRLRNRWIREGKLIRGSDLDLHFVVPLLLVAEHTWGLDVKTYLKNYDKYEFYKYPEFINSPTCKYIERSWNEKRAYIFQAIAALPVDLQRQTYSALTQLTPIQPTSTEIRRMHLLNNTRIDTKFFRVGFDKATGAINYLMMKNGQKELANAAHILGEFAYQTYSNSDYSLFIKQYCRHPDEWWVPYDYGKPELSKTSAQSQIRYYHENHLWVRQNRYNTQVLLELLINETENAPYGAPKKVYIHYTFPNDKPEIDITLDWFGKNSNRMPEAIWFSFVPALNHSTLWIDKMGTLVNAKDVVFNGARAIHGVTKYIQFDQEGQKVTIESLDAPVIELNQRNVLNFDNAIADPSKGVNYCLFNNAWGTNYPQWIGYDMRFRFKITF